MFRITPPNAPQKQKHSKCKGERKRQTDGRSAPHTRGAHGSLRLLSHCSASEYVKSYDFIAAPPDITKRSIRTREREPQTNRGGREEEGLHVLFSRPHYSAKAI